MATDPKKSYEAVAMVLMCIAISFISVVAIYFTGLTRSLTVGAHALLIIINAMVYASCILVLIKQFRG